MPENLTVAHANSILATASEEMATVRAIEDAVPDGSWDGYQVIANLRAAGFDVVKAGAR